MKERQYGTSGPFNPDPMDQKQSSSGPAEVSNTEAEITH